MSSRVTTGLAISICGALLAIACSGTISDDVVVGYGAAPPSFSEPPDASTEAATRELTAYCASNQCPTGFTTCPASKFLCEVDLRSDRDNCGACGAACPPDRDTESFDCIEGRCVMRCPQLIKKNCDGIIDNGCETEVATNDNCGACGKVCADPENAPCQNELDYGNPECGCPAPYTYCNPQIYGGGDKCNKLDVSDRHCGACGNRCNPDGPPGALPPPPNAYYGCVAGQCHRLTCKEGWGDCNQDLNEPGSDGCEVQLGTDTNCVTCGDNCAADGRVCALNFPREFVKACRCPPGETFCGWGGSTEYGSCSDLRSDPFNCGACGESCPGNTVRSRGICELGACKLACNKRWADCNGNVDDDCEVDIFADPQNCGGCGIACDVAAGQACAGGRCVVEPCKEEGEETAR